MKIYFSVHICFFCLFVCFCFFFFFFFFYFFFFFFVFFFYFFFVSMENIMCYRFPSFCFLDEILASFLQQEEMNWFSSKLKQSRLLACALLLFWMNYILVRVNWTTHSILSASFNFIINNLVRKYVTGLSECK